MYTIELDDEELRLVRSAIGSYVREFGHDEAEVLRAMKALMARLPGPATPATASTG